jgi:hypothetical protein
MNLSKVELPFEQLFCLDIATVRSIVCRAMALLSDNYWKQQFINNSQRVLLTQLILGKIKPGAYQ